MKTVLIVRKFDEFSRILAESGFEIINLPTIKIVSIKNLRELEAKLKAIENYDGIFLTSANAAQIFIEKLRGLKINFCGKIYVFGRRSFDLLKTEKLDLVFDESANTTREFLEKIPLEDFHGKRFLFVRGEKSLRVVPEILEKFAKIDETVVYETRKIVFEIDKINALRQKIRKREIVCACFFNPSAAESFIEQFGAEVLHQTKLATIGRTTAEFFGERNLKVNFISSQATAEDFAVGLIEYLQSGKRETENGK